MMSDLIDRQAAIDALEESKKTYFDRRVIIGKMQDILVNLPSAQPEIKGLITEDGRIKILTAQHWIPCSERLPDRVGFYWTTAVGGSGTRTMTSRFFDGTKWERKRRDYTKVIAWMPFPEAYKEGE